MKKQIRHLFRFSHKFRNKDQIILRDYLAMERTTLANERTMLTYIRSSLYFVVGGIALIKLEDFRNLRLLGYLALALALLFIIIGVYRYLKLRRRLKRYYDQAEKMRKTSKDEKNNPKV